MSTLKNCPYCAQEIQSQATVCPLCNRNLPGTPLTAGTRKGITYTQAGRLTVIVAVATVAMMAWATRWQPATFENRPQPALQNFENRPKPALQISGTRHPRGIEVTNRETESLSSCVINIPEQWHASVQRLAPLETNTVLWAQFRNAGGIEMPADIGQTARYATVTCDSHKEKRKSAALRLR